MGKWLLSAEILTSPLNNFAWIVLRLDFPQIDFFHFFGDSSGASGLHR